MVCLYTALSYTTLQDTTKTGAERSGASIYVQRNDRDVHIRVRALQNNSLPNGERPYEFIRCSSSRALRDPSNPSHAFKIDGQRYIAEVIEVIRAGP